jgi:hypothetical protein
MERLLLMAWDDYHRCWPNPTFSGVSETGMPSLAQNLPDFVHHVDQAERFLQKVNAGLQHAMGRSAP